MPSQASKLLTNKSSRDGRPLKIVLDGKRPITEADSWWAGNTGCPRPTASLTRGSRHRPLHSSATSYPHAIANMRKRSITESESNTRSGVRHFGLRRHQPIRETSQHMLSDDCATDALPLD